jgi:hypothetical protein
VSTPAERLEYLRGQIDAECIAWGEIAELQGLAAYIDPGDVQLLEWAGVPEFSDGAEDGEVSYVEMADYPPHILHLLRHARTGDERRRISRQFYAVTVAWRTSWKATWEADHAW